MQTRAQIFRSVGGCPLLTAAASLMCIPFSMSALAQAAEVSQASATAAVIPQQVRYAGALPGHAGEAVEAVFKIYAGAEGGEALWTESQRISVGRDGTYTVLLGAVSESGLPQGVFAAGQARWLGVTVDRAEGVRAPLASVAYAMKAGDAETVGGLAAASIATKDDLAKLAATGVTAVEAPQIQSATTPTGSGTADYVPLWTASSTLGNSGIYQAASGFIGIGTTTPGGPLQLSTAASGGANATMMLTQTSTASGNYYADIGLYNSKGLIGNLSALGSGYPAGNLFVANDVVFLGGQQNAGTNLIFLTNTSGALKFGTGGFAVSNERMRIGAAGGVSVGNSYVGTDPGAGNLIVSGKVGVGTTAPAAALEVNGTAKFDGLVTFDSAQTFPGTGKGTITGITTTSPLTGSGTSGTVALGLNTAALETTLETSFDDRYALLTGGNTFNSNLVAAQTAGPGYAALTGFGSNGSLGTYGSSDSGYGVEGVSSSGTGVMGVSTTGNAGSFSNADDAKSTIYAINSGGFNGTYPVAVNGTATGQLSVGILGSGVLYGVWGQNATAGSPAVYGDATGNDGYGVAGTDSGTGSYAVYGHAMGGLDSTNYVPAGVYGLADNGTGVEGFAVGESDVYKGLLSDNDSAGVWGDTSATANLAGVVGTADNNYAALFVNNSSEYATVFAQNESSGGTGLFKVFKALTPLGTCGIGDGNLSCTGQVKMLATTGGGSRTVETYAMHSPEDWMEDFGTGTMEGGVGVVQIDPAFADTVSADANYHVFLTPNGDSKGLYVTAKTAGGFEVHEAGGGRSSLSFDYRIVAKSRGHEAQRLVDVTDRFNAEQSETKRRMPSPAAVAQGSKKVVGDRLTGSPGMPGVRPGSGPSSTPVPIVRKSPAAQKPVAKPM